MKKNILTILFSTILILCLSGCNSKKEGIVNDNKDNMVKKSYNLDEIKLDCNLSNILYINNRYILTQEDIYEYSDKKFAETDTNCKIIAENDSNYKYIGVDYGEPVFINEKNKVIKTENGIVGSPRKNNKNINDNYSASYFYQGDNFYVIDNKFYCTNDAICSDFEIPNNEKILYTADSSNIPIFIITDKNQYLLGTNKNDKCHDYVNIKCTYELIETNIFDDFLNDYKNNIVYFSGEYLVTKDNKIYKVNFSN